MRVGILGCGGMGKVHGRHYRSMPDVNLLIYDISSAKIEEFLKTNSATVADSAEDLIKKSDIVDICLPTFLHYEFAKRSLEAQKPTLCEKPLCRTVHECLSLIEIAEKKKTPLMPAQVVRFFPEFRKAHDIIQSGTIGKPAAIRTRRGGRFPTSAATWMANHELSGGIILDLMIHDFDWIRWTFGEIETVFADALTFANPKNTDYALATLSLKSGAIAHVEGTWADPAGFRVTFSVAGSKGLIEHDSRNTNTLRISAEGTNLPQSPLHTQDDPYFLQLKTFLNAVKSNIKTPVSPIDGLSAVAIAQAAIKSATTGSPQKPYQP